MVICRNCRSSLPDGTRFCRKCGYKIGVVPVAQISHEDLSSASNNIGHADEIVQGVDNKWDDTSPTDPSLLPVHGDHRQPLLTHGERQHTQPLQLTYMQPRPAHSPHQETQPIQLTPQHSQAIRRAHEKTQPMQLTDLQPQALENAHEQSQVMPTVYYPPVEEHSKYPNTVQRERRPLYLAIAISSLIVVTLVAITLLFVYFNRSNHVASTITINATLVTSGKAIPGQTLQVVGNHFPPSQTVMVTLNGQPLAQNGVMVNTSHSSVLNLFAVSLLSPGVSGTPVTVQADGTFTVTVHIDTRWTVGSTHHLSVYDQQGAELKSIDLTVEIDQSMGETRVLDNVSESGTIEVQNIHISSFNIKE